MCNFLALEILFVYIMPKKREKLTQKHGLMLRLRECCEVIDNICKCFIIGIGQYQSFNGIFIDAFSESIKALMKSSGGAKTASGNLLVLTLLW